MPTRKPKTESDRMREWIESEAIKRIREDWPKICHAHTKDEADHSTLNITLTTKRTDENELEHEVKSKLDLPGRKTKQKSKGSGQQLVLADA